MIMSEPSLPEYKDFHPFVVSFRSWESDLKVQLSSPGGEKKFFIGTAFLN